MSEIEMDAMFRSSKRGIDYKVTGKLQDAGANVAKYLGVTERDEWFTRDNPTFRKEIVDFGFTDVVCWAKTRIIDSDGNVAEEVGTAPIKVWDKKKNASVFSEDALQRATTNAYGRCLSRLGYDALFASDFPDSLRLKGGAKGGSNPSGAGSGSGTINEKQAYLLSKKAEALGTKSSNPKFLGWLNKQLGTSYKAPEEMEWKRFNDALEIIDKKIQSRQDSDNAE